MKMKRLKHILRRNNLKGEKTRVGGIDHTEGTKHCRKMKLRNKGTLTKRNYINLKREKIYTIKKT